MPVVTFSLADLQRLVGGAQPKERILDALPQLGGDLEKVDGDTVHVEYFPDRADLLSVEGIARALRSFLGVAPGLARYKLAPPAGVLQVDATVAAVRPCIVMCKVEGIPPLEDTTLRGLMDFQEKLGNGIGRKRRRVAIGIHDAASVSGPYRYTTVPGTYRFHPLQGEREMTVTEILTQHTKGQAFAHLLPKNGPFPAILDKDGHLLSLPPVINGTRTELRVGTRDLILDLTGPEPGAILTAMSILTASFLERGAKVVPFTVSYPREPRFGPWSGNTVVTPDLAPRVGRLRVSEANRLLGLGLPTADIIRFLAKLGHDAHTDPKDPTILRTESPSWRADLLHEWDLIEDVAKGFGYGNFPETQPSVPSHGKPHPSARRTRLVRTALIGHGYLEATTLTLTSPKTQQENFDVKASATAPARVTNPSSEEHAETRTWITPSLFMLLAANRHRDYPQSLFEVGQVVLPESGHRNAWRVAVVRADARFGFTQVKSLATSLLTDLGLAAKVEEDDHPAFIPGRVACLVDASGAIVGRFGEFHPRVLERFALAVPVAGLELDLDALLPAEKV